MAPFVRYDFDTDSPELLATLGRGCGVHSTILRARKAPYPTPVFTRKERYLFHPQEPFSPIVSKAVDGLRDVTLRAEVHRYRRFTRRAERLRRQLGDLRQESEEAARTAYQSQERLAEADAYARVTNHIQDHLEEPTHPEMRRRYEAGLRRLVDSSAEEPELTAPRCNWCLRTGHDAQRCRMIARCELCGCRGHHEYDCEHPHRSCEYNVPCRVPDDHEGLEQRCPGVPEVRRTTPYERALSRPNPTRPSRGYERR